MEIIKLKSLGELKAGENLSEVPGLVKQYLNMKEYNAQGQHFRLTIDQESNPVSGHGIAYSNALRIEKRNGESWNEIYNSGMREYRGAYASDIDNWDLALYDPAILEEGKNEMIYALRTGAKNIKICRFKDDKTKNLITFNLGDYKSSKKRIELLQRVIEDDKAYREYVNEKLRGRWSVRDEEILSNGKIVILLARHSDRDFDAITDAYQILIWVKGRGINNTNKFPTGLHHPSGRFYYVGIGFSATITTEGKGFARVNVKVYNKKQNWESVHDLRIQWNEENGISFKQKAEEAMEQIVQSCQHNHRLYKPTRITEKVIDMKRKVAVWILFEQIDTDRLSEQGEGWLGDQFRYSLWKINDNNTPVQLYEDHAYIRPWTKSELTGTRGRDCTLKNLRIEGNKIKVLHPEGERIEKQEWKELTFDI